MADVSFAVGTIGYPIPFLLEDGPGVPLSNATSTVAVWLTPDGTQRRLTLVSPASATYCYVTSAGDFPAPTLQRGTVRVSVGTSCFFYAAPLVRVTERAY